MCSRERGKDREKESEKEKRFLWPRVFLFFLRNCYSFEIIKRVQKFEDSLLTWRAAKIRSGAAIHPMQ